jgi:hypothetical protein
VKVTIEVEAEADQDGSLSYDRMTSTPPSPSDQVIPEKEVYDIELNKDGKGLGITVAGYVCEKGQQSEIKNNRKKEVFKLTKNHLQNSLKSCT